MCHSISVKSEGTRAIGVHCFFTSIVSCCHVCGSGRMVSGCYVCKKNKNILLIVGGATETACIFRFCFFLFFSVFFVFFCFFLFFSVFFVVNCFKLF